MKQLTEKQKLFRQKYLNLEHSVKTRLKQNREVFKHELDSLINFSNNTGDESFKKECLGFIKFVSSKIKEGEV